MKTRIHVNRHHIQANAKDGGVRPVYTIKQGRRTKYAQSVEIEGKVRLVDPRTTKPLSCGAKAWIEVLDGAVTLCGETTFAAIRGV